MIVACKFCLKKIIFKESCYAFAYLLHCEYAQCTRSMWNHQYPHLDYEGVRIIWF